MNGAGEEKCWHKKILFIIEVTLLGRYCRPNGSLNPPPLSPPSSITQTLPQMSSCCCHVKLRPIGCNQEMRQVCPLYDQVTFTPPPTSCSVLFSFSRAPCFIPHFCPHTLATSFFTPLTDYRLHSSANLHLQLLVFSGFMTLLHVFITAINTPDPFVRSFNTQSRLGINTMS